MQYLTIWTYSVENLLPFYLQPKYQKKKPDMLHMLSIWDKNYRVKPRAILHETQLPDRPSLQGKEVHVKAKFKKRTPQKRVREGTFVCYSNKQACHMGSKNTVPFI